MGNIISLKSKTFYPKYIVNNEPTQLVIDLLNNINPDKEFTAKCTNTYIYLSKFIISLDESSPIRQYTDFSTLLESAEYIVGKADTNLELIREDSELQDLYILVGKISYIMLSAGSSKEAFYLYQERDNVLEAILNTICSSNRYPIETMLRLESSMKSIFEYTGKLYILLYYISVLYGHESTRKYVISMVEEVGNNSDAIYIIVY